MRDADGDVGAGRDRAGDRRRSRLGSTGDLVCLRDSHDCLLGAASSPAYQMSFGYFLISAAIGEEEIDGFLAALERALHTLELVGSG